MKSKYMGKIAIFKDFGRFSKGAVIGEREDSITVYWGIGDRKGETQDVDLKNVVEQRTYLDIQK